MNPQDQPTPQITEQKTVPPAPIETKSTPVSAVIARIAGVVFLLSLALEGITGIMYAANGQPSLLPTPYSTLNSVIMFVSLVIILLRTKNHAKN